MFGVMTTAAMAASMFAVPAATADTDKGSSITYPLETGIESVSWYAQEGIVPHEKFKDTSIQPIVDGYEKVVILRRELSYGKKEK